MCFILTSNNSKQHLPIFMNLSKMKRHITCLSKKLSQKSYLKTVPTRFLSTKEALERRNHLFTLEKKRQQEAVGRLEKIEVQYKGLPKDVTLIMNKDVSSPYDCARHLSEWHTETSALALLDGTVYWDMHRPLPENCTLELLNFRSSEPQQVNKAFWRTCSMLLGAAASVAFKDTVTVRLHSFPGPDIRSGSFIYDIDIPSLPDWKPTPEELRTLSAECVKLARSAVPLERLEASEALARELFHGDQHKSGQVPSIAQHDGKVILYRMGTHIDISKGPLISNTSQIGAFTVASIHKLEGPSDGALKQLYRFQGLALPKGIGLNHFTLSILMERAKKLNPALSPFNRTADLERASATV